MAKSGTATRSIKSAKAWATPAALTRNKLVRSCMTGGRLPNSAAKEVLGAAAVRGYGKVQAEKHQRVQHQVGDAAQLAKRAVKAKPNQTVDGKDRVRSANGT